MSATSRPFRSVVVAGAALLLLGIAVLVLSGGPAMAGEAGDDTEVTEVTQPDGGETEGEAIRGVIEQKDGRESTPIEGVTIIVRRDDEVIGEAVTDVDGGFLISVPEPGFYDVELESGSLPDGVVLKDQDRSVLVDFEVRPGQQKRAVFPIEGGVSGQRSDLERFLNLVVKGLTIGAIVALASVGLSLIFGLTGLVNFAHGELVAFGAIMAWLFNASGAGPGWPLLVAIVPAVLLGAAMGGGLEWGLFRRLRRRRTGNVALIVVTIGLSLFLRNTYLLFLGGAPHNYRDYAVQRARDYGPISAPPKDLVIIAVSVLVLVLLGLMLQRTRIGTAMRAVSDNKDLSESSGIDVNRVILVTWILAGGLAALGGIFLGITETVTFDMGFTLLLIMFAAVLLGGIGTAYGAMAGGFLIGVVMETSTYFVDTEFKLVAALGVLILVMLIRPQGLFGTRERIG